METSTSTFESSPTHSGSVDRTPKRKLVDEFDGPIVPEAVSSPVKVVSGNIEGFFEDMEGDIPDEDILKICETVSSHVTTQEERAQVRRSKNVVTPEKIEELRNQLGKIDHTKRSEMCPFFSCVYDSSKVTRSTSFCSFSEHENIAVPIDFCAPYGPAYYNATTGSPLIKLCDHSPCYPAQSEIFAATKVFNMDGQLSQEPIVNEGYLPWFPNRQHHKNGKVAEEMMKLALKREGGPDQGLGDIQQIEFIDMLMCGTQKYPEVFYRNGNRLSFLHLIVEQGIANRVAAKLSADRDFSVNPPKNDEIIEAVIQACKDQMEVRVDYELLGNLLLDDLVDRFELASNSRGLLFSSRRYQPFDLFGTLVSNFKWFKALPAVFYRVPASDVTWYDRVERTIRAEGTEYKKQDADADFKKAVAAYPTIGDFVQEDKFKPPVKVWFKSERGVRQFNYQVANDQGNHFMKFAESNVLHFIDSLLDMAFLYAKDVSKIAKELEFLCAEWKYCNQEGFKPTREEFGLDPEDKFEINVSEKREFLLRTNLIKEFDLPSFEFYLLNESYVGIKRSYKFSMETQLYKFPIENMMFILRRLIKLAMNEKSMVHIKVADEHTNVYHYAKERCIKVLEACRENMSAVQENEVDEEGSSQETIVIKKQKMM